MIEKSVPLPCPFCGGKAEFGVVPYKRECRINHDHGGEFIQCTNNRCAASSMLIFPTMADAKPLLLEKWNKRVSAAPEPATPPLSQPLHIYRLIDAFTPTVYDGHLESAPPPYVNVSEGAISHGNNGVVVTVRSSKKSDGTAGDTAAIYIDSRDFHRLLVRVARWLGWLPMTEEDWLKYYNIEKDKL